MASLTNDVNELTFLSALINGIGAIGSTMGFVISAKKFNLVGACAINLTLFFLAMPGLFWVSHFKVMDTAHGTSLTNICEVDEGVSLPNTDAEAAVVHDEKKTVAIRASSTDI